MAYSGDGPRKFHTRDWIARTQHAKQQPHRQPENAGPGKGTHANIAGGHTAGAHANQNFISLESGARHLFDLQDLRGTVAAASNGEHGVSFPFGLS